MIPKSLFAADRRHHTCLHETYWIQPTGKSFRVRVEMCYEWAWQPAARSASCGGGVCSKSVERLCDSDAG